jgi:hypothetical protein
MRKKTGKKASTSQPIKPETKRKIMEAFGEAIARTGFADVGKKIVDAANAGEDGMSLTAIFGSTIMKRFDEWLTKGSRAVLSLNLVSQTRMALCHAEESASFGTSSSFGIRTRILLGFLLRAE